MFHSFLSIYTQFILYMTCPSTFLFTIILGSYGDFNVNIILKIKSSNSSMLVIFC